MIAVSARMDVLPGPAGSAGKTESLTSGCGGYQAEPGYPLTARFAPAATYGREAQRYETSFKPSAWQQGREKAAYMAKAAAATLAMKRVTWIRR